LASDTFILLKANWIKVQIIATELLRKHRLNSREVHELIQLKMVANSQVQGP
jgi:hypothetical protein